jgi:hypothetical protein
MRPFVHYFEQFTPALVVMIPVAIATLNRPQRMTATVIAAGFFALKAASTIAYLGLIHSVLSEGHVPRRRMDDVVAVIRQASRPGDSLLAAGRQSAYLAFASGLPPTTPFFWDGFWDALIPLSGTTVEAARSALRAAPPEILALQMDERSDRLPEIVKGGSLAPILREWLAEGRYDEIAAANGYRVFRRRGEKRPDVRRRAPRAPKRPT